MKKHFLLLSLIITALSLTAQRNVLVEELTGTWCQYCPGGIYYGDSLSHAYDNVYFVAVHTIDAMGNEEYATHGAYKCSGGEHRAQAHEQIV